MGAPELQGGFGVSYGLAAGWTLVAMQVLSILLEPPLFALADRFPKRRFVVAGIAVVGVTCIAAGLAPSYAILLGALALYGPANGCGVGVAQAALMDAHPEARERMLTRWTLRACLGDLATPALLSILALLGAGWRTALVVAGTMALVHAALLALRMGPEPDAGADRQSSCDPAEASVEADSTEDVPLLVAARRALSHRPLLFWTAALTLCSLLDETLVAFGSLYLRDRMGAGVHARGLVLTAWMVGGVMGLLVTDRLLRRVAPLRLLLGASLGCGAAYAGWLMAPSLLTSAAALMLVGAFAAAHYPIAKAQAYRALPGQSGMVNAVAVMTGPIDVAMLLGIGLCADHVGIASAMMLLGLQPLGLAAAAVWALGRDRPSAARPARLVD